MYKKYLGINGIALQRQACQSKLRIPQLRSESLHLAKECNYFVSDCLKSITARPSCIRPQSRNHELQWPEQHHTCAGIISADTLDEYYKPANATLIYIVTVSNCVL